MTDLLTFIGGMLILAILVLIAVKFAPQPMRPEQDEDDQRANIEQRSRRNQ